MPVLIDGQAFIKIRLRIQPGQFLNHMPVYIPNQFSPGTFRLLDIFYGLFSVKIIVQIFI